MQRLAIGLLQPEMIAPLDVIDPSGRVLLRAGMACQENHIQAVTRVSYGSVYASLHLCKAEPPDEILSRDLHENLIKTVTQTYVAFRDKNEIDGTKIRELTNQLVDEVVINRGNLVQWVDLRTPDAYLSAHAVNVAILSVLIGMKLEYTGKPRYNACLE